MGRFGLYAGVDGLRWHAEPSSLAALAPPGKDSVESGVGLEVLGGGSRPQRTRGAERQADGRRARRRNWRGYLLSQAFSGVLMVPADHSKKPGSANNPAS